MVDTTPGDTRGALLRRVEAAESVAWTQPPVAQPAARRFEPASRAFRVAVMWPTGPGHSGEFDILDVDQHIRLARALERAGVDWVLIPDGWANRATGDADAGLRSVLWAVPIALETERIGIVTSMRTTYMAPMHIARFGSHIDWLSGGRWSWCVVPGGDDAQAALYGRDLPDLATRYRMAADSVAAVRAIWDGAEAGVDHEGPYFRVSGRSKRPFLTQTVLPPLVGAGSSPEAMRLAASDLDVWITDDGDATQLRSHRSVLEATASAFGRTAPRVYLKTVFGPVPGRQHVPRHAERGGLPAEPEDAAEVLCERALAGLIDGALLDLPSFSDDDLQRVSELVAALGRGRILEPMSARAVRW